ncbi:outer membrane beta-barrel protein [Yoonia sp. BS5-3]|uniref:Outer membrane protein n=1 Tax=Yoonia phaeophyticola TaxID=3137369 RepID=A0ABZ2V8U0_9RHOB
MNSLKKISLVTAIVAFAFPASANDILPAPAVVAHASDWSGAYVGGSLGTATHSSYFCDDGAAFASCSDPDKSSLPNPEADGSLVGITAGYDWQNGSIVYGVAGDLMFGDISGSVGSTAGFGCFDETCGLEVTSVTILRGRAGYDMGDILPFATAGVALTEVSSFDENGSGSEGTFQNFVIGVGVDYRISDTFTIGADVLHLLENDEFIDPDTAAQCSYCGLTSHSATIARINFAYLF